MEATITALLITISQLAPTGHQVDPGQKPVARTFTVSGFVSLNACRRSEKFVLKELSPASDGQEITAKCLSVPNADPSDPAVSMSSAVVSMLITLSGSQRHTTLASRTYTIQGFRSFAACSRADSKVAAQAKIGNAGHSVQVNCLSIPNVDPADVSPSKRSQAQ